MKKKEELYSCSQQDHNAMAETDIKMVPIADLHDFEGHPFKVENDMALFELMQSIEKEGVIVPALARPRAEGGYELIAGHRRKAASKWAGLDVMPVVIRELDDNQAVIAMVDSNLQREHLKPSEKAFAYKMKLDAMKRQGARTDLTFCQVGEKLENPTLQTHSLAGGYDADGKWMLLQDKSVEDAIIRSNQSLAMQTGESQRQISRYIRLTNLIPKLLDMVDDGKIAFTIAVELSYLTEEQQYELYEVMDMEQCTPSLSQANRIKRMSQYGELDMDVMFLILEQEKPNQRVVVVIFIAVVFIVAGKDSKERIDMVSKLTEEQRNILMSTEVNFVEKNAWVQKAMVAKMKDKGNKIDIRLLWFNEVLQNNEYNKITIADVAITKSEQEEHNVKEGDFVKFYFAPEKSIGRTKIIWE